MKYMYYADMEG